MKNHIPHPSILNSNKRINWPILKTKIHIYFHLRIKVKEEQSWKSKKKRKEKLTQNSYKCLLKKKKKILKMKCEYIQLSNVMITTSVTISHMTSCERWRKCNGPMWITTPSLTTRHTVSCAINCGYDITFLSFSIFTIQPSLTLIIS